MPKQLLNFIIMETIVKAPAKTNAKKVNVKAKSKTATKTVAKKAPKVSEYKSQVIGVNRELKIEASSVGGCIRKILMFAPQTNLSKERIAMLKAIQKDNDIYKAFKDTVRASKKGTYSDWAVLQAVHKAFKVK